KPAAGSNPRRHHSPEHRAKIAAALRGRPGRPHSPETRARISAANKGRPGRPHSPETRARIAAALKGREVSPETRANMSAARKGRPGHPNMVTNKLLAQLSSIWGAPPDLSSILVSPSESHLSSRFVLGLVPQKPIDWQTSV